MSRTKNPFNNIKSLGNAQIDAVKKNTSDMVHSARDLIDRSKDAAIQAMDQTGDGKVDLDDVAAVAGGIGDAIKNGAQSIERNTLNPIFPEALESMGGQLPKIICVADRDIRYSKSPVCQGAIGYYSMPKGYETWNLFHDAVGSELSFYPGLDNGVYYVDPMDANHYIAVQKYYDYIKQVHVGELQQIAQALGAKHFRVVFKNEKKSSSQQLFKGHVKAAAVNTEGQHASQSKESSNMSIAAEMEFPGHAPEMPQLRYLADDPSIKNLIALRMDRSSPLQRQHYTLKLSNTSGMTMSDAARIDAVLKGLKVNADASLESQAKEESTTLLEYDIEF